MLLKFKRLMINSTQLVGQEPLHHALDIEETKKQQELRQSTSGKTFTTQLHSKKHRDLSSASEPSVDWSQDISREMAVSLLIYAPEKESHMQHGVQQEAFKNYVFVRNLA